MTLAEFLSFKKFDIEEDIINNPTSFTVDSLTQAIKDSIYLLRPIRSSSQRTAKVIKSIMEQYMKKRGIGWYYDESNDRVPDSWVYDRTIESDILKLWLYRFSEQNLSYNNAYNALVPYLNTGNAFPVNLRQIEDTELIEFIRKDKEEEIQYEKFERQLAQEYATITRPLSTSFPSFRMFTALKLKRKPFELKNALEADFFEFNTMIDLVPNNESDRQNMKDQLESFSIQYPDWNFGVEESKEIVSNVQDGRRDEILYNTICKLKDLKSDHNYRNLTLELDDYIKQLEAVNNKAKSDTIIKNQPDQDFQKTIESIYPTKDQFIECDVLSECDELFEEHKRNFNHTKQKTISIPAFIEKEIKDLEAHRDDVNPPKTVTFKKAINLYPFYIHGWESAISGIFSVPNNIHKFYPEIIDLCYTINNGIEPTIEFLESLSKVAMEEAIEGMADAKYYYWLKDIEKSNDLEKTTPVLVNTNIVLKGIEVVLSIEDKLMIIKYLFEIQIEAKVKANFIRIFTKYQSWEENPNFKAECLALPINEPVHKKSIKVIENLSDEIIALFYKLSNYSYGFDDNLEYTILVTPKGQRIQKFHLIQKSTDHKDKFHYIDGKWWPYHEPKLSKEEKIKQSEEIMEFWRKNEEENPGFIMVENDTLFDLAVQISSFIKERVLLISNNKTIDSEFEETLEKVFPTIVISKYDPDKIFNQCISKKVIKCDKDIFDAYLVSGTGSLEAKIKWLFQGGNKAQLRAFMNKITGENVKPAQLNKIFEVNKVNSNDDPAKLSSDLEQILILSPIKKVK
jgi:hypothetical protein